MPTSPLATSYRFSLEKAATTDKARQQMVARRRRYFLYTLATAALLGALGYFL